MQRSVYSDMCRHVAGKFIGLSNEGTPYNKAYLMNLLRKSFAYGTSACDESMDNQNPISI